MLVWCMVPEIWKFFCHFGPFFALLHPLLPKNQKNQHFEKREKNDWRYYHFPHVYHKWQSYDGSWDMKSHRQNFLSLWTVLPFNPPNKPENQNFEKMKWVITRQIAKKKTVSPNWLIFGTSVALHVCMKLAKLFQLFLKKTLWPLFMDGVQLRQG